MAEYEDSEYEEGAPEETAVELEDEDDEEQYTVALDSPNMVFDLMASERGREFLKDFSAKCLIERDEAVESSERYVEAVGADWRIFAGELPDKEPPFDKMANLNIPINLENISRLTFRTEGEIFGNWKDFFGVEPLGSDDRETAEILSRHGNWQLTQIRDFERQMRRGILMFYQFGDVTFQSEFDVERGMNRHEALTPEEFYTPYTSVSTMPDWSDVPYRGRVYDYYAQDLEHYIGAWYGVEDVLRRIPAWDDDPEDRPLSESVRSIHREELPSDGPAPYRILAHETWCTLPGQVRRRFVRAIIDISTETVLSLSLHEAPSFRELAIHRGRMMDYENYIQAKAEYDQAVTQVIQQVAPEAALAEGAERDQMMEGIGAFMPEGVQPPQKPSWMGEDEGPPDDPEMSPIHTFTHAVCIEPLTGSRGLGFGRYQADFNRMANSVANHQIDSSTLSNLPPVIADAEANLARLVVGPGYVNQVQGDGKRNITDMVNVLPITHDNGNLMKLLEYADSRSREAIQSPQVLSGEPGKSGESAKGLLARIGEASKQLSVSTRAFVKQGLEGVLVQNARLNSIYMPEEEVFWVNDELGNPQMFRAGREMYVRTPYKVVIRGDLKFTSDVEKVQAADSLVSMSMQDPTIVDNMAFHYEALKKSLEARGQGDMVPLLGARPDMSTVQPFGQAYMQQKQMMMQQQQQQQAAEAQAAAGPPGA